MIILLEKSETKSYPEFSKVLIAAIRAISIPIEYFSIPNIK